MSQLLSVVLAKIDFRNSDNAPHIFDFIDLLPASRKHYLAKLNDGKDFLEYTFWAVCIQKRTKQFLAGP